MASSARTALVVPVFNGAGLMPALLESVAVQTCIPDVIIIVDNASTDGWHIDSESFRVPIETIRLKRNYGFGVACNVGIRRALDYGAHRVFVSNQDIVFDCRACEMAIDAYQRNSGYGVLILFQVNYNRPAIDDLFRKYLPAEFVDELFFGLGTDVYEVRFAPFAAFLISREAFEKVGGFDPLFFLYGEDNDFCERARRLGVKIGISIRSRARHWGGQLNSRKDFAWQVNWMLSRALLHLKWSPRPLAFAYLTLTRQLLFCRLGDIGPWVVAFIESLGRYRELRERRKPLAARGFVTESVLVE